MKRLLFLSAYFIVGWFMNQSATKNLTWLFFLIFISCLPLLAQSAFGQPSLARLFSDNVVLQRQKPIPVWGWAKASERVTVSLGESMESTIAGEDGKWIVRLPAMDAGGAHLLKVSTPSGTVFVKNIAIGEVWLCSGQSNMEFTVKQAANFDLEKMDSNYPEIRHFYVDHVVDIRPKDRLEKGDWKISTPESFGDFTAVGFFFAREIYKKLGVPVGLLHSSWGGSQIEGWISKDAMLKSDEFSDYAQNFPETWADADAKLEQRIKRITLGNKDLNRTPADEKNYTKKDYDFSGWHKAGAMGQWDWQGIWAWRGNGYMAKSFEIGENFASQETTLGLAEGHQYLEVFINGKQIFNGILKGKRKISVPKNVWMSGKNNLVVKMNRMIEPDWFGLGMMGSEKDLFVAADKQRIQLGGNNWHLMPSFAEDHKYAHSSNNIGTAIFNGMIAPLLPFGIRGVLWYQGETNAGRAYQYRKTFPLLIKDWRTKWNEQFPFYFVQLSSFGRNQSSNEGSGWAELREAQSMTLTLPNTGMAVTTDIGDPTDIHPINKQDVGKRLAANALHFTYGKDIRCCSPMFDSAKFKNGEAIVYFKFAYDGLKAKDKFGYLRGFEIAGADRRFYYAQAEIEGEKVVVRSAKVPTPIAVRYAWSDAPIDANLYNSEGFPASPFRTDNWDGITKDERFGY